MDGRSLRVPLTIAAVVLTVGSVSPQANSSNAVPLHVLLTISSNLTTMARGVLIAEAERIWRRERVKIEWARAGHEIEHPDAPLRVLVVARPPLATDGFRGWPVAELVPEATPRAIAFAWISGAERVVDEAARSAVVDTPAPRDYRLGLVLGRAVAHEIGHFLLATETHATSGLMRATVDAREFAAVGGGNFSLDPDASQWLRGRLAISTDAVRSPREGGFSYLRRETPDTQFPTPAASLLGAGNW
jgi:hypothetical protein